MANKSKEILTPAQESYKKVLIQWVCDLKGNYNIKLIKELKEKTIEELEKMRFELYNKFNKKFGGGKYSFHSSEVKNNW